MSKFKEVIFPLLVILVAVGAFVWIGYALLFDQPVFGASPPAAGFDHSNCQYPDRWSNPINGCDNSDPAVPECIKGMSSESDEKQCIDAFVKSKDEPAPISDSTVAPAASQSVKPLSCTGN